MSKSDHFWGPSDFLEAEAGGGWARENEDVNGFDKEDGLLK